MEKEKIKKGAYDASLLATAFVKLMNVIIAIVFFSKLNVEIGSVKGVLYLIGLLILFPLLQSIYNVADKQIDTYKEQQKNNPNPS